MMGATELRRAFWMAGASFRNCPACGHEFIVGIKGHRRADSKFCCDDCRDSYHNYKRYFLKTCQQDGVAR